MLPLCAVLVLRGALQIARFSWLFDSNFGRKRMKLTMLGVGNAMTLDHYNTCFVVSDESNHLLVDAGGGNRVLKQLELAGIDWKDIREMFITHHHIDHFLGAIWMVRMVGYFCSKGLYEGEFTVYANEDVLSLLDQMCRQLLNSAEIAYIGKTIHLVAIHDGETHTLLGRDTTFFDIHSPKLVQHGFVMDIEPGNAERRLACCGDEPFHEAARPYVQGCEWMLHEAFCLHAQEDVYHPYNIYHSTVKDACENATSLGVRNLVLYHSEEDTEPNRQRLYREEAQQYFAGNLYVPDDLDVIEIG